MDSNNFRPVKTSVNFSQKLTQKNKKLITLQYRYNAVRYRTGNDQTNKINKNYR